MTEVSPAISFYSKYGKRAIDVLAAICALVVLSPVYLIVSIFVFFGVGRPLIFKQVRAGRGGRPFTLYKFHNMTEETDENGNLLPEIERITRVGRVLRASSLDELPQFVNILKGDMSVIGPRPLFLDYVERYNPRQAKRLFVRPGLACPLPKGKSQQSSWDAQLENDAWYAEHVSLRTDVIFLARLFVLVFDKTDNKIRSEAGRNEFLGSETLKEMESEEHEYSR